LIGTGCVRSVTLSALETGAGGVSSFSPADVVQPAANIRTGNTDIAVSF